MSKRRINKQQSARIKKIQEAYQEDIAPDHATLLDGLVISRFSKHVEIEDQHGVRSRCSIRPNLDLLVAGDKIIWQAEGPHQGVVLSVYPRTSVLAKPTHSGLKPVAANMTQMVIVIAPKPKISWTLLDCYLVMAETLKIRPVIILNKVDLPCDSEKKRMLVDYQALGYPLIMSHQNESAAIEQLKQVLNHQVSVFVGQSGVGKSTLIASLLPNESNIAVGPLSEGSELGTHTTSNSRYYHLASGGALIDSPGVRQFSLWNIDALSLAQGYKELKPLISLCKFRNCTHQNTPQCALIKAVEQGIVSRNRYENFIHLMKTRGLS